jgi:hypothetical protein
MAIAPRGGCGHPELFIETKRKDRRLSVMMRQNLTSVTPTHRERSPAFDSLRKSMQPQLLEGSAIPFFVSR